MATSAGTERPATGASLPRSAPSPTTSRQTLLSVPVCGSIALWNFSAPVAEARHWNERIASPPRATACRLSARYCPGALGTLTVRQLTALGACSISTHGRPPPTERVRSQVMAESRCASGSAGSG